MTSVAKTTISPDVSYLVDGEQADAADVRTPVNQLRDYVRDGRVGVTAADTHVKHLDDAVAAGTGISKGVTSPGGNEALQLSVDTAVVATVDNALSISNKTLVSPVIADFTSAGHDHEDAAGGGTLSAAAIGSGTLAHERGGLEADVSAYSGLIKISGGATAQAVAGTDYVTPAGSESISNKTIGSSNKIAVGAIDPDNNAGAGLLDVLAWGGTGYVPTAMGGGGAQPIDLTVTAGEALAERDRVYISLSDGKAYKVDTDAVPIKIGAIRGVVNQAGGIAAEGTGTVRILGEVSGYTGLTAWADVYSSTTAGGYTQTKPTVTDGGGQVAVDRIGYAVSTSKVLVLPGAVQYAKRVELANDGTLTITHHADPQGRGREARAYVSTSADNAVATYASSNQDSDVHLRDRTETYGSDTLSGGTVTASTFASGANLNAGLAVDNNIGTGWQTATSTPTGWIRYDYGAGVTKVPARVTVGASANGLTRSVKDFTIEGSNDASNWTVLSTVTGQTGWSTSEVRTFNFANSTAYRYVRLNITAVDGGAEANISEWEVMEVNTTNGPDKLAQTFQVSNPATVSKAQLLLKKTGSPTGTLTLRVETVSGGNPTGTLVDANATATLSESSLATGYGTAEFVFAGTFSLSAATAYALVLSTDRSASTTNYISWGADGSTPGYASGEMLREASSTWSAESKDAIFDVWETGTAYDEPCVVGRWSGGTRDIGVKYLDGSNANGDTNTTFKNVSGGTLDVTCMVEV